MRILLITDWMSDHGGAEWYVTVVREELRDRGHDARLLASDVSAEARAAADYTAYGSRNVVAQSALQIVNPWAVATLRHVLRSFQPEVVHLSMIEHHLSPAILPLLGEVPAILSVMDYKRVCPTSWKLLPDGSICTRPAGVVCWRAGCTSLPHWLRDRPRYALLEWGYGRIDRLLACSRTVEDQLGRAGVDSEVLALPVRPAGSTFRRRPATDPLFVYLGRLSREKGVDLLLRALADLLVAVPTARLRIVGRGPERTTLEHQARELGIEDRVTFTGWVPPATVERELRDAWALVAPSLHREPLGLVAPEAILRGVPVIASAEGGFAETVEEGSSGLLFPNGDRQGLAHRLEAVATGRAFPDHRAAPDAMREIAQRHDLGRHIDTLVGIYEDSVRSRTENG